MVLKAEGEEHRRNISFLWKCFCGEQNWDRENNEIIRSPSEKF